ncbi:hypothetical protein NLI96_g10685 [Meripilus lineatus]|uniref:Uncharacterized protein n=1 Tax=Meripilus lineatus TaxID=2056292 RepID=A0AAD5YBQ8_9APHY|nr:hypothetical protein NLI96_g10685 [Physisporinus lineatus]
MPSSQNLSPPYYASHLPHHLFSPATNPPSDCHQVGDFIYNPSGLLDLGFSASQWMETIATLENCSGSLIQWAPISEPPQPVTTP